MTIRIQKNEIDGELYNKLFESLLPRNDKVPSWRMNTNDAFYSNMIVHGCYFYVSDASPIEIDAETGLVTSTGWNLFAGSAAKLESINKILCGVREKLINIGSARKTMAEFNGEGDKEYFGAHIAICNLCGDVIVGGNEKIGWGHVTECHLKINADVHFAHSPANYVTSVGGENLECVICGELYDTMGRKDLKSVMEYKYCNQASCGKRSRSSNLMWGNYPLTALELIKDHLLTAHSDLDKYKKIMEFSERNRVN